MFFFLERNMSRRWLPQHWFQPLITDHVRNKWSEADDITGHISEVDAQVMVLHMDVLLFDKLIVTVNIHLSFKTNKWSDWKFSLFDSNLQLLQLETEVDEFDHRVLLSLRVFRQLQDQLLALLDGQFQLLNVRCYEWTLGKTKHKSEEEEVRHAGQQRGSLIVHQPWVWRSGLQQAPCPWSDQNCGFWSRRRIQALLLEQRGAQWRVKVLLKPVRALSHTQLLKVR